MIPRLDNLASFKTGPAAGLNLKQKRFADYYLIYGNSAEAARRAGYSPKSAIWFGSTLYNNPKIRAYIDAVIKEQDTDNMASIAEITRRLTTLMRGSAKEQVVAVEGLGQGRSKAKIVEKTISAREQLEAAKKLIELHSMIGNFDPEPDGTTSTDEKLLKALQTRKVNIDVPDNIKYEEDSDNVDNAE